ncbi:hypothetical protein NOL02_10295, partial [Streptococcus suis]|uniref:hypothetical protein n=1 Tax=Streptococcus suis TaxID=1307 RepID=UPI00241283B6
LSPLPHDSQAWESLWGSPVAGVHRGLSPQMYDMPVVHSKSQSHFETGFMVLIKTKLSFLPYHFRLVSPPNRKNKSKGNTSFLFNTFMLS